jgi:GAF domain-containing protein
MKRLIYSYGNLGTNRQEQIKGLFALCVFYGGAFLQDTAINSIELDKWDKLGAQFAAVAVLVFIYISIVNYAERILEERGQDELERRRAISYAVSQGNNLISMQISEMQRAIADQDVSPIDALCCVACMKEIVRKTYQYFESHHGQSERFSDRIDFEVTFMTRSYIDDGITIPAYENRQGRAPFSMKDRPNNSHLYDRTVTASVYKETRPNIRIVEDTADPKSRYTELYDGQKERIRSSVIYPVLSTANELIGTLVVHCNSPGFFKASDSPFWRELLEVYAVRLAFEKTKLDLIKKVAEGSAGLMKWKPPF